MSKIPAAIVCARFVACTLHRENAAFERDADVLALHPRQRDLNMVPMLILVGVAGWRPARDVHGAKGLLKQPIYVNRWKCHRCPPFCDGSECLLSNRLMSTCRALSPMRAGFTESCRYR